MDVQRLPDGWSVAALADVCDIHAGYGFPKRLQGRRSGDLPFFKVGDISEAWKSGYTYLSSGNNYLTYDEANSIKAKALLPDTTVFAKIGAAIALNRRSMLSQPSLVDNNVMGVSPLHDVLFAKFLFYFMCTVAFGNVSRATAVPSIRKEDIANISISLPPLAEQRRIVAEIEKQFTRLDASVAALRRTRANLKRYRASVLRAACSGELAPTEAELARSEGREYEPASVLLERILAERRAHWDAQEKRRGKYKEPAAPDASDLPPLPEGWVWATASQVSTSLLGKMLDKKRTSGKHLPYLRNLNVRWDGFDLSDLATMPFVEEEFDRYNLLPGDVLVAEGGEPGRSAVWTGYERPIKYQKALHRVRMAGGVSPKWLVFQLWSSAQTGKLEGYFTGSTIKHFTGQSFERFAIPLPPLAEQRRIVSEVERRLSVIQQAEAAVESSLQRAERLRQSILKRAFSGELAPQDPDDEPASVLLERIRAQREAERAKAAATKKGPARRRRQNPTRKEAAA